MKKKRFVYFTLLNLGALFVLYTGVFHFQLGADLKSESSEIEISYQIKDDKARRIGDARKYIIMSGSNSLFGVDSGLLSQMLDAPVLNLGVHVSLDINYLYFKLEKYVGAQDVILMPLEYNHYSRAGYSDWFVHNMMVWEPDYFHSLGVLDKARFIFNVNVDRLIEGIRGRLKNGLYRSPDNIVESLRALIEAEGVKWRGYSYTSMNLDGDISVDEPGTISLSQAYLPTEPQPSAHFLAAYKKIQALAQRRGARLVLVHPVTFRNEKYDLHSERDRQRVEVFTRTLQDAGVQIDCNPALFHLDEQFAFDTFYHTNRKGALVRTENLAYCIQQVLKRETAVISYEQAEKRTAALQDKYEKQATNLE